MRCISHLRPTNWTTGSGAESEELMMNACLARPLRTLTFLAVLIFCSALSASADPIPVRHVEGTLHGFLALRTQDGKLVAVGDLTQTVRGDQVTSRLVFRFKDGSVDDETTVFSQHGTFRLITNHRIQKGPSFPQPLDLSIDARSGRVTVRSIGNDGKEEVRVEHLDLPPDLANGLVLSIAKNLPPETPETKLSILIATPKPRIVKLAILPRGEESFSVAGSARKAMRYDLKLELGAITGLVAPLIGKQPPDFHIWILGGKAPAFVKEEGVLYEGGPILTIELTSPVWPQGSNSRSSK